MKSFSCSLIYNQLEFHDSKVTTHPSKNYDVLSIANVDEIDNISKINSTDIVPPVPALFNNIYNIKVQCNNDMLELKFDQCILSSKIYVSDIIQDSSFMKHFSEISYQNIRLLFLGAYNKYDKQI